jgi:hypothetical protein
MFYGFVYLKQVICDFIIIGYMSRITRRTWAAIAIYIFLSRLIRINQNPRMSLRLLTMCAPSSIGWTNSRFALVQPSSSTHSDDVCEIL